MRQPHDESSVRGQITALQFSAVLLSVVAVVLVVQLLAVSAGWGSPEPSALAEMAASVGDYNLMTTASNEDEELLFVIDNRNEQLLVYGIGQPVQLQLLARESIDEVFATARAAAGGGRR